MIKPIFIFSLPRTGSTLLQRVLMSHSKISSFAEPHFLLPFIYANKKEGTISSYSHVSSYKAVSDIVKNLPHGKNTYYKYLKEFSLKIYEDISDENSIYFLDKTPVYVWVIPDIIKIFPNAKIIFLFRNPVQVYASIVSTFSNNKFNKLYRFKRYLDYGFELLSKNYEEFKEISISIKYEDFIKNPEEELMALLSYLDVDYEEGMLDLFDKQDLVGRSMDPTGVKLYNKIERQTLEKWKLVFNTKYRIKILRNYIKTLSDRSLKIQGYNKQTILNNIKNTRPKRSLNDIMDFIHFNWNKLVVLLNINVLLAENYKWARKHYIN